MAMAILLLGAFARTHAAAPAHDVQDHMNDDPFRVFVLADRLEWQRDDGADRAAWDATATAGKDENRLWLRTEGERAAGVTRSSRVEALWGRPIARWWDLLAGVRRDFAPGDSRTWAALGVAGIAPYAFDVQLTAYLGAHGAAAVKAQIEYELAWTQRFILQPRAELRLQDSAPAHAALGLRVRYEIRRELAPYVGVEWSGTEGDGDALRAVAGIRLQWL